MSVYNRLEAENAKLRAELAKFKGLPKKQVDFASYTHAQLVQECTNYQLWFERNTDDTDELKREIANLEKRLKATISRFEKERKRNKK